MHSMLPKDIQILLFSATFPDNVMKYAEKFAPRANQMRLRQQELTVAGISQMYMDCPSQTDKYDVLCKLYGLMTIGSSVIFVKVYNILDIFLCCGLDEADECYRRVRVLTRFNAAWKPTDTGCLHFTEPTRGRTAMLSWTTSGPESPRS